MFANWLSAHACKVRVMKWAAVGIIVFHGALLFVPPGQMMLALVLMDHLLRNRGQVAGSDRPER